MYQIKIYLNVLLLLKQILCFSDRRLDISTSIAAVTPCSLGLQFLVALNNTSGDDLEVELNPEECCLNANNIVDCDVLQLTGCYGVVPKDSIKTMKMIAPLIGPYDRYGYCSIYVDSKPKTFKRGIVRNTARINFDTRLDSADKLPTKVKKCNNIDEDPLNDCKAVDCETYYDGIKPYFDKRMKRCVEVPACIDNPITDVPEIIYDENANKCIRKAITKDDIDKVKDCNESKRVAKDLVIINNIKTKNNTKSTHSLRSTTKRTVNNNVKTLNFQEKKTDDSIISRLKMYLKKNHCTIMFFGLIIIAQCCLICGIGYYWTKSCTKCCKKDVVRKFFNCRQDVSVTTPLINTSNVDTETDYQYLSDSCNNDKKIKRYKACQKERKHHITRSLSDDILCKCLDRCIRAKHEVKSDTATDLEKENIVEKEEFIKNKPIDELQKDEILNYVVEYVANKDLVNYGSENKNRRTQNALENIGKTSCVHDVDFDETLTVETEVKCRNFEDREGYQISNTETCGYVHTDHTTVSMSKDDEAQALMPADSLDEFLSQRGLIYASGENFLGYQRSSDSGSKKILSGVSSKTSKNNVLRNVLSIFKKKINSVSSFNPELDMKSDENLEIGNINISREALYLSSNNESNCFRDCAKVKESRSSF